MTSNQLFAAALGIAAPWFVRTVDFDAGQRRLTIHVDFAPGSRFTHPKAPGVGASHAGPREDRPARRGLGQARQDGVERRLYARRLETVLAYEARQEPQLLECRQGRDRCRRVR